MTTEDETFLALRRLTFEQAVIEWNAYIATQTATAIWPLDEFWDRIGWTIEEFAIEFQRRKDARSR